MGGVLVHLFPYFFLNSLDISTTLYNTVYFILSAWGVPGKCCVFLLRNTILMLDFNRYE